MIKVTVFAFNPFQENTYVLFDETKECVIIDPGCNSEDERKRLDAYIAENNLKPVKILNTHCHVDHMLGVVYLKEKYGMSFHYHKEDDYLIPGAVEHGRMFGFELQQPPQADEYLEEAKNVKFGNSELEVLHVPGHCKGHVAFYAKEEQFLFAGDVLFAGSIGRTDLPGGDYDS